MVKAILPKLGSNQIDQIFAKEMSGPGSRVDRLGDHRTLFANRQPQPQPPPLLLPLKAGFALCSSFMLILFLADGELPGPCDALTGVLKSCSDDGCTVLAGGMLSRTGGHGTDHIL